MRRELHWQRILVVSLDNVGDLVFSSALTTPLHTAFPDATIDVWCKAYTAPIASLIPHVTRVIAADPFWARPMSSPRPSLSAFVRSISAVRNNHYDLAVLSEAPWRTAAAVAVTKIPMRVGLARHRNSAFLTHVLPAQDAQKSVLREQARLLSSLSVESPNPTYRLDAARLGTVRDQIARQVPERFVALHPFAGNRARCVPLRGWSQVSLGLADRGFSTVWIGTHEELDRVRASHAPERSIYADQLGDGSLRSSAAVLSLACVFMGHDSGPLHIAGAFGVPVVGIFAPGQPARTFPQGPGASRMIHQPTPASITAESMLHEIDALLLASPR